MNRKYVCHQCGAKYSALAEHKRRWGHNDVFPCDVCHNTFSREDNLRQHKLKHDNNSFHECVDCHQIFNRPDNLELHRARHHGQTGGRRKRQSLSPQPGPSTESSITKYDNPEDMYTIRVVDEHKMPKLRDYVYPIQSDVQGQQATVFALAVGKTKGYSFNELDTRNNFCKWLFSDDKSGATVFCHNFKGYDSYPIMNSL
ncbi:hypothetical protein FSP39_006722 [Pinctada imbricata]|uniref:C2H2-type domain-containing protein n=1 Tax=Pinctada imbricata TaxID=66713 RepID=A0AA88XCL3_PINIB|nr:hypothetical protein FSP39_006722 [Pinctada imbricata]